MYSEDDDVEDITLKELKKYILNTNSFIIIPVHIDALTMPKNTMRLSLNKKERNEKETIIQLKKKNLKNSSLITRSMNGHPFAN